MVIVASVALSIMVSNDIVMPVLLRRKLMRRSVHRADFTKTLLRVRRTSIIVVLMLGYAYYRGADSQSGLASIGLLSFGRRPDGPVPARRARLAPGERARGHTRHVARLPVLGTSAFRAPPRPPLQLSHRRAGPSFGPPRHPQFPNRT